MGQAQSQSMGVSDCSGCYGSGEDGKFTPSYYYSSRSFKNFLLKVLENNPDQIS